MGLHLCSHVLTTTQTALLNRSHSLFHTHIGTVPYMVFTDNTGFRIKDTWTCGLEEQGVKPLTLHSQPPTVRAWSKDLLIQMATATNN